MWRSLRLPLEQIRLSLDKEAFNCPDALQRQRALLVRRLSQTHQMIASIDAALTKLGDRERPIDFKSMFDGFDPADYEEETKIRWEDTTAYQESNRRTKYYSDADWSLLKSELDLIWSDAALAMRQDVSPNDYVALELVERHRKHVCRWFYDLSLEAHEGLAKMWQADDRFGTNIDKHGEGLTAWFAEAVKAAGEAV